MGETSSVRGDRAALLCWWGWGRGAVQVTELCGATLRMLGPKGAAAGWGAHIMNMKKLALFVGCPLGVVVMPNASSSLSKHWVPVHTVCLSSVFRTSCMPGR
eukprot:scaffold64380_cov60-Phaeocystis_antarctica.AAC.7